MLNSISVKVTKPFSYGKERQLICKPLSLQFNQGSSRFFTALFDKILISRTLPKKPHGDSNKPTHYLSCCFAQCKNPKVSQDTMRTFLVYATIIRQLIQFDLESVENILSPFLFSWKCEASNSNNILNPMNLDKMLFLVLACSSSKSLRGAICIIKPLF